MGAAISSLTPADLGAARALLSEVWPEAATVADEKLFLPGAGGPAAPWGARAGGRLLGVSVVSDAWLRLIAVAPAARGQGIGSALLDHARTIIGAEHRALRLAAQPGNYLFPGISAADEASLGWLDRRGFARTGENVNLLVDVASNPKISLARCQELAERTAASGYTIARAAGLEDVGGLAASFGPSWALEVGRALEAAPGGVHVARDHAGVAVAFAAHDGNNRGLGWFGPAGTLEAHRGRGLGAALLLPCLVEIAAAGHDLATIAWIGPRQFYQRVAGVVGERRYITFEMEINS